MKYPTQSIPTEYNGVHFRSRLEATWAKFFDLCGWCYEFEPIDLAGYIPDFMLRGANDVVLVDVKPIMEPSQYMSRAIELRDVTSGYTLLVLGAGLLESTIVDGKAIGYLGQPDGPNGEAVFDCATLMTCVECGAKSFVHDSMSWQSRMCGHYDGDALIGAFDEAQDLWNEAKNGTQWKAVKPARFLSGVKHAHL